MTDTRPEEAASQSLLTVLVALAANALIAVAKTFAAVITGSASMVAEAAHSWADTGNEGFLLVAQRRSAQPADVSHPLGYGREAYVWSMFAAFGLFGAGAVVAVWHGIQAFAQGPGGEPVNYTLAYAVLGIAFVLEGVSFLQARREARASASRFGMRPLHYLMQTSNPTVRAVFAEDAAALAGIVIATVAMGLHEVTGDARYDAVGSILVGLLLGVIAIFLLARNRDFLVGQAVPADVRERALGELLAQPEIETVSFLHLEFVGPERILLIAAVDLVGDAPESHLAATMNQVQQRLQQAPMIERAMLTLSPPAPQ